MSDLRFQIDWRNQPEIAGAELQATWAELRIDVNGESVTRLKDTATGTTHEFVCLSAYPLAEWITLNWWPLLHEIISNDRIAKDDFIKRHNFKTITDGYAFPSFSIVSEGSHFRLTWEKIELPECGINYISEGFLLVERDRVESELRNFIGKVVDRLATQKLTDNFLIEEWNAVRQSTDDEQEREFCQVAGMLGCDPYSLSKEATESIMDVHNRLPGFLHDEFYITADIDQLTEQVDALRQFIDNAKSNDVRLDKLMELRESTNSLDGYNTPWTQGYESARQIRDLLKINGEKILTLTDYVKLFDIKDDDWKKVLSTNNPNLSYLDAATAVNTVGSPLFFIGDMNRRDASQKFALGRALHEFLYSPTDQIVSIVSSTHSNRQKRNRAFAAEFLAPKSLIEEQIPGKTISEESINTLADDFGVSEYVIRHQIKNHGLAHIVEVGSQESSDARTKS